MHDPSESRKRERKQTQRHCVVEKHKHKCTLQILLVTLEMRNKEKDVNESSEVSKFTRLFPFLEPPASKYSSLICFIFS